MLSDHEPCRPVGLGWAWLCNDIDHNDNDMGVSTHEGTPEWMVFFMETPNGTWMMNRGTPIKMPFRQSTMLE